MKRQFDAACRQYQVKSAQMENLWTTSRTWPSNGLEYDAVTQTYTCQAGTLTFNNYIYDLPNSIPAGTSVSMSVFVDSGRWEGAEASTLRIIGCNRELGAVTLIEIRLPAGTDLAGTVWKGSVMLQDPLNGFAIAASRSVAVTVIEPIKFRVMLVIGDTPAETFKPHGVHKHAWTDGLKSGLPSVKLLGKTEQAANPTPETPQNVRGNHATVRSCGKNLFNLNWVNGAYDMLTRKGDEYGYVDGAEFVANMGLYNAGVCWHDGQHFYTIPKGNWKVSAEFWVPSGLKCVSDVYLQFYNIGLERTAIGKYQNIPIETWTKVEASFSVDSTNTELFSGVSCRAGGAGDKNQYTNLGVRIRNVELMRADDVSEMFTPYFDGGEATAPELYAIGDYKDEWDSQTGKGIRRIAKVVLTGSETYVVQMSLTNTIRYSTNPDSIINTPSQNNNFVLCSHLPTDASDGDVEHCCGRNDSFHLFVGKNRLQGTTIAMWIKAQYDAGTPVTVWYVLAEPVPFETDPMPLSCPTGYGQIIQVAGDVPDAPLEVKYLSHGGHVK